MPRKFTIKSKYENPDTFIDKLKKKIGRPWIKPEGQYMAKTIGRYQVDDVQVGDTVIIECVVERISALPDFEHRLTLRQEEVRLV